MIDDAMPSQSDPSLKPPIGEMTTWWGYSRYNMEICHLLVT